MQGIPKNTATAALRRVSFTLVDATDLVTPEDITVTGEKPDLSVAGGTPTASTNDIVKVDGTDGEYYLEFTQAEVNVDAGTVIRGWIQPSGCALTKFAVQIVPAGATAEPITTGALRDDALDMIANMTNADTTLTFKDSTNANYVIGVTRAARDAIATTTPPSP